MGKGILNCSKAGDNIGLQQTPLPETSSGKEVEVYFYTDTLARWMVREILCNLLPQPEERKME